MLDTLVTVSPWLLLATGAALFLLMANALWPLRHPLLMFQSFLAGLTVRETAAHHLLWQLPLVALLIAAGALHRWIGVLGFVLVSLSWLGLAGLFVVARRDAAVVRSQGEPVTELPSGSYPAAHLVAPPLAFMRRDIAVERSVEYCAVDGVRLRLDVFGPRTEGRLRPAVVQVHGGGWVSGFKRFQGVPLLGQLASLGWVGFNVDYRLGPRATFPAHLIDVKRAIAWIREHAEEYGVDPSFIVVTGGSAGAHLAALVGLTVDDPEYQPGFEHADASVAAVAAFYGVYDLTERRHPLGRFVRVFLERWVLKKRYDEDPEAFVRASPIERVRPDAPPFYVVHGTADTITPVAGARAFVQRLREVSRAPVDYLEVPGAVHAFDMLPSLRTGATVEVITRKLLALHREYVLRRERGASEPAAAADATAAAAGEATAGATA